MRPILTLRQYTHDLIVHSHDHAQLVFGLSGALDFEVDGRGSQVVQQSFVVVPSGFHHACGSPNGSRCLVLDVPSDGWVTQNLGDHADGRRQVGHVPASVFLFRRKKSVSRSKPEFTRFIKKDGIHSSFPDS